MKRQKYALYRGGPKRLQVEWTYGLKKAVIKFDGAEVGTVTKKELKKGHSFHLPDGSSLHIKFGVHPLTFSPIPSLSLDGKPVPGSIDDPAFELKISSNAFITGGLFNLMGGFVYYSVNPPWYTVLLFGVGLAALVVGVYVRRRSRDALKVGIGLAVISALSFLLPFTSGVRVNLTSFENLFDLIDSALFVVGLSKGFAAIAYLEKEDLEKIQA